MATIGSYELRGELGRGGAGVVYRAHDPSLRRDVALKMLLAARTEEAHLKRFLREARTLARVRHPGIVSVHEAGQDQGRPYIVMDLVDGESLEARLDRDGPMPPREAVQLIVTAARALEAAHGEAVIHRDLKPANILLSRTGEVLVTDFGLAKDLDDPRRSNSISVSGRFMGTPGFAAPEQVHGGAVSPATDVYGLGATLFAMLTGEPPFTGDSIVEVVIAATVRPAPAPSERGGPADPDLDAICARCLRKPPEERFRAAAGLADACERYLRGERTAATAPGGRAGGLSPGTVALVALSILAVLLAVSTTVLGIRVATKDEPLDPVVDGSTSLAGASEPGQPLVSGDVEPTELSEIPDASGRTSEAETDARLARGREVAAVLAQVRSGRLADRPGGYDDALLTIVRRGDAKTAALLVAELDPISTRLREIAFDVLRSANDLTDEERAAGERVIPDLDRTIAWIAEGPPWETRKRSSTSIHEAIARIERRGTDVRELTALEQRRRVGDKLLRTAALCCDALGYLDAGEEATGALLRHLFAERDATRAIPAAIALARIGDPEASRYVRQRIAELRPDVEIPKGKPVALVSDGPLERALREFGFFDRTKDHLRSSETPSGETSFQRWLNRSSAALAKGDLDGARTAHDRALELGAEEFLGTWDLDGKIRYQRGDFEGAIAAWTHAIDMSKSPQASLLSSRGIVRRSAGDLEGSLVDLDRSVEIWSNANSLKHRGKTRLALGDVDGALADFEASVADDPDYATGWACLALARSLQPDRRDAALDAARRGCELGANDTRTWHALGVVQVRRGDLPAALDAFEEALKLEPRNPEVFRDRGYALAEAGRAPEALLDLALARDRAPSYLIWWRADVVAKIAELTADGR